MLIPIVLICQADLHDWMLFITINLSIIFWENWKIDFNVFLTKLTVLLNIKAILTSPCAYQV